MKRSQKGRKTQVCKQHQNDVRVTEGSTHIGVLVFSALAREHVSLDRCKGGQNCKALGDLWYSDESSVHSSLSEESLRHSSWSTLERSTPEWGEWV
jgi:hypothetical protein